ncbi:MAG TPA: glycosyltransferase family 39 protein, partial [Armatimonadota bacterium]|nr:glycosyltransferase family 39 protein [Armatimonadota bacterium]
MKIPAALRRVHLPTLLALTAFFGALLLRAWGLTWGLPSAARYYPYHPDETVLLNAICGVNPLWGDVAPTFYNYGSLHILLSRLAYDVVSPFLGWGTVPRFDQPFPSWVGDFARLLLVGRWMTVLLGAATVPATYALGRRLFSARTGWLAALFLAVAPLPVLLSHYLTVDVPAAFFTTLSLFFAAQALGSAEPKPALRWVAAAGFVAGLAIGTKYSSLPALLALGVPLWHLSRAKGGRSRAIAAGALAVALCAAGFLLATPGALLEPVKFSKDLAYEMGRNREGQGLLFKATPPALLYHLGISLPVGLEWPLYLLSMAGVAVALWRRRPADWLLLVFLGLTFLMLAPAERKFLRYVTPLFPPL